VIDEVRFSLHRVDRLFFVCDARNGPLPSFPESGVVFVLSTGFASESLSGSTAGSFDAGAAAGFEASSFGKSSDSSLGACCSTTGFFFFFAASATLTVASDSAVLVLRTRRIFASDLIPHLRTRIEARLESGD